MAKTKAKSRAKSKSSSNVKVSVNVGSKNRYSRPRRGVNLTPAPMFPLPPIVLQHHSSAPQVVFVPNQSTDTSRLPPVGITNHIHQTQASGNVPDGARHSTEASKEPEKETSAGEKASMVGSGIKVAGEVLEHISPTAGKLVQKAGAAIETAGGLASSAQKVAENFPLTSGLVSSVAAGASNLVRGNKEGAEARVELPQLGKPYAQMTNKELQNIILERRPADDKRGVTKLNKQELLDYANTL